MPTGYTADVQNGTVTDFATFAMDCARAFGALIHIRDMDSDAPVPEEITPETDYDDQQITNATSRLNKLADMSDADKQRGAKDAYRQHLDGIRASNARSAEYRARYETMLKQVAAWEPPTDEHVGLKTFMEEQLRESIHFDCPDYSADDGPKSPEEWWLDEIDAATRALNYSSRERTKTIERAAQRTAWVRALRESLEVP